MVKYWNGTQYQTIPDGATGPTGPEGPIGPTGATGPPGQDGLNGQDGAAGADAHDSFEYIQASPSGTWVINHDLNRPCAVTILDTLGVAVQADVYFVTSSRVTIEFTVPFAGRAYLT